MQYGPMGALAFSWSKNKTKKAPWELKLELVSGGKNRWGYLSMARMSARQALHLDVNVFTEHFQTALADALDRICRSLDELEEGRENRAKNHSSRRSSLAAEVTAD